jgi:hypothetical protein
MHAGLRREVFNPGSRRMQIVPDPDDRTRVRPNVRTSRTCTFMSYQHQRRLTMT